MREFAQDLRYAWRRLAASPAFTAIAVLMLALGIGANSAIFSLVSTVFLRPPGFPDSGRLVAVWEETRLFGLKYSPPAMGNYVDWRASNQVFTDMGGLESRMFRLTGAGEPEEVAGSVVTASLLGVLGVKPLLGRSFLPSEDQPGTPKTAILSHHLWLRHFGGDVAVIGRQVPVDGEKYTIVGVMPEGFRFPGMDEMWAPVGTSFRPSEFTNRGRHNLMVVARLEPGVTVERAGENLRAIAARLAREYPNTNTNVGVFITPLAENSASTVRSLYGTLLAAVGLVLLIACANLASLLLARAAGRHREMAIRAAMGASRVRIARQLLAESILLSGLGSGLGLLLACWSFRFLERLVPRGIAAMATLSLDGCALAFTLGLTVLTALAFGAAPLVQILGADLNEALKQGSARSGTDGGAGRLRNALVVCEVAVSFLLLVGAGLMIQSFAKLRAVNPGFPTARLLTMRVAPSPVKYEEPARQTAFYREVLRHIQAQPGVVSAGFTTGIPVMMKGWFNGVVAEGAMARSGGDVPTVNYRSVTSAYLQTLGVPLRRGRYLAERDSADAPRVAAINETMARKFWPGQDAIGKRFKQGDWGPDAPWYTVVGVVDDIRQSGLDAPPRPEMYLPQPQQPSLPSGLAVRTLAPPDTVASAVRRAIREVDPEQTVSDVRTMEEVLDRDVSGRRLQSTLLGAFSAMAVLLASLGIYGVLSYTVARRTREIGIRMALGARRGDILSGVVRHSMLLAAVGVGMGAAAALGLTRTLGSLLYGVSATDPKTFLATAVLMLAVAALAAALPARRALRVDPIHTLRDE